MSSFVGNVALTLPVSSATLTPVVCGVDVCTGPPEVDDEDDRAEVDNPVDVDADAEDVDKDVDTAPLALATTTTEAADVVPNVTWPTSETAEVVITRRTPLEASESFESGPLPPSSPPAPDVDVDPNNNAFTFLKPPTGFEDILLIVIQIYRST